MLIGPVQLDKPLDWKSSQARCWWTRLRAGSFSWMEPL